MRRKLTSKEELIKEIKEDFGSFIKQENIHYPVPKKVKNIIDYLYSDYEYNKEVTPTQAILWKHEVKGLNPTKLLYYIDCSSDVFHICNKYTLVFVQYDVKTKFTTPVFVYLSLKSLKALKKLKKAKHPAVRVISQEMTYL